jgi:hypothetical protein
VSENVSLSVSAISFLKMPMLQLFSSAVRQSLTILNTYVCARVCVCVRARLHTCVCNSIAYILLCTEADGL